MPTVLLGISFLCNLLNSLLIYFFPTKLKSFLPFSSSSSWLFSNSHATLQPITSSPSSSSSSSSLSSSSSSLLVINNNQVMDQQTFESAHSMDPAELKRVFQMFDRNGDGRITKKELSDSLDNLGIFIPDKELTQMIEKIDVNKDGCVDIEEFGALYQTIMDERDEEEDMREAFNVFDQNGDGFITVEELRSVLSSLGLKQGRTVEDCRQMIKKVDVDGDGMVNFKEFKQMMRGGGFAALT